MASKDKASILLFLSLNLFLLVSSHDVNYNSDGSPSSTNSGNPVVIHPGNVLPNSNNTRGQSGTCNPLNLGVCLNLLGLVDVELGNVPTKPCCSLIEGLLDLEAAVCLCTAVRANVLGININLPISLSLLLNNCGRSVDTEYICSTDNTDNNSKGSSSTTQSTNTTDNNSKGSSTTNSTNPKNNSSKGSSSTTNSPNSENNNSNGSSSTTNSENPNNNSSKGSSSTTNSPNSENNNSNGPSSTINSANPKNNSSKGSSSITNPTNPIVIRPGDVLPSGSNKQSQNGTCNPLNLGVCVNLLGLVDVELGDVPTEPCCSVIEGLLDLEAAVCLCTAVRANVLGINIDLPISLSLLLNNCGRDVATEYICGS